MELKTVSNNK